MAENNKRNESDPIEESNAARRIRLLGQTEEEPEMEAVEVNKLANFWYHNKVWIVISAFFIIVIGIAVAQYTTRNNPDVTLLYAGPDYITANDARDFCGAIESILPDYNEDGKIYSDINAYVFMTNEQLAEAKAKAEEVGVNFDFDVSANINNDRMFSVDVFSGKWGLCFLAEGQYENVKGMEAFVPLSELLDEVPDYAVDEYGIRLGDTKFYKFFDNAKAMPEDVIIAMRRITVVGEFTAGKSAQEKYYKANCDLLKRIVEFEYPEGYVEPSES